MFRNGTASRQRIKARLSARRRPDLDLLEDRRLLASALAALSVPITPGPVEGTSFTAIVARFNDADQNTDPTQYSATIDWGNGHTSGGQIAVDPKGGFDVVGTYTYNDPGPFTLTAQIQDKDGDSATAKTTNIVTDATLMATGTTIDATPQHGAQECRRRHVHRRRSRRQARRLRRHDRLGRRHLLGRQDRARQGGRRLRRPGDAHLQGHRRLCCPGRDPRRRQGDRLDDRSTPRRT